MSKLRILMDLRRLTEWSEITEVTRELILYTLTTCIEMGLVGDVCINSLIRTEEEERQISLDISEKIGRPYKTSGIHKYGRAGDIDYDQNINTDALVNSIAMKVNRRFIYDHQRRNMSCVIVHFGHLHCQTHPNTTYSP